MTAWHTAACVTYEPELWFGLDIRAAKRVCRGCPVRTPCLEGALARQEPDGVWGGLTHLERNRRLGGRGGRRGGLVDAAPTRALIVAAREAGYSAAAIDRACPGVDYGVILRCWSGQTARITRASAAGIAAGLRRLGVSAVVEAVSA
jgi:hypothetical protein